MDTIEPTEITASTTVTAEPTETTAGASAPAAEPDALAASLAQAAPSAGLLDTLAFDRLSPTGRLDAAMAWERLARHAQAGLTRVLGALAREGDEQGWPVDDEICAALAWSPSTTQNRLADAQALTRLFPQTLHQLSEGHISAEQARSLAQLTAALPDNAAQAVQARVLPRMPDQNMPATRQAIRRAIVRADPHAAAQRHQHQRARRRVELWPEDDGMATLNFYLPADIAQMAMRTLTTLAQSAKRANKDSSDKRTLDQRRADLLPVLLHHAATGGSFTRASKPTIPAQVNVVVGIETLLNLSHEPGHLAGYGPICPEQTRRIAHAHAARWRFLLTSSDGTVVDASPRTYKPTAAVKHITELKYTTCAFPHCRMPADRCDIDHNTAFHKGGATSVDNLAPLCHRHHNHKSTGHWQLNRTDDTIHWTSTTTGRRYTTTPTRYQPAPRITK